MSVFSLMGNLEIKQYQGNECILVLDTETNDLPPKGLVYDLGMTFIECLPDGSLQIVNRFGVLISEIFTNSKLMKRAYFANKVFEAYPYLLASGQEALKPWELAIAEIGFLLNQYKVRKVGAYNANFDQRMLAATAIALNSHDIFSDLEWFDLWQIACNTVLKTEAYAEWAVANGYISPKGNILTSAEVCYNYLNLASFDEDHTALSDSMLEAHILLDIAKEHGTSLFTSASMRGATWQAVNNAARKEWLKTHNVKLESIKQCLETRY